MCFYMKNFKYSNCLRLDPCFLSFLPHIEGDPEGKPSDRGKQDDGHGICVKKRRAYEFVASGNICRRRHISEHICVRYVFHRAYKKYYSDNRLEEYRIEYKSNSRNKVHTSHDAFGECLFSCGCVHDSRMSYVSCSSNNRHTSFSLRSFGNEHHITLVPLSHLRVIVEIPALHDISWSLRPKPSFLPCPLSPFASTHR